ncbi:MAG TPA: glycosyltransferase [Methylomirabilota bacterium]|jgi:dolichol-phosphate mannosyltransferase|nr:glycosyltransferase [Methylomirabilota bacterium]
MISIILATYNERESIETTVTTLLKEAPEEMEVIVVDDDSPDRTWQVVEALRLPQVKVIRRVGTRGLASAFNRGIIESRGDYLGWMDADMSMPPAMIPRMYRMLVDERYDIVIASRYAPGGTDDRHWLRTLSSRLINGFASLVLGHGIKDYDSGFVLIRRSVLDSVSLHPRGYGEYFIEFIYNACRKGLRVGEIGYYFRDRTVGVSKSAPSLVRFFMTGAQYVVRIVSARLRKID